MSAEDPKSPDLSVLNAKAEVALLKLGVLDKDNEKTYGKLVSMEKAAKLNHASILEVVERIEGRQDQMLKALQKTTNEVMVVRRAVEPGHFVRLSIMFAGSMAGGAMVNLFLKVIGIDLPSKIYALLP